MYDAKKCNYACHLTFITSPPSLAKQAVHVAKIANNRTWSKSCRLCVVRVSRELVIL